MIGFGPHLMIDGYECDEKVLDSVHDIHNFLLILPEKINMTRIDYPYLIVYDSPNKPEDRGISGFVIIAESHISVHTFPVKKYVSVDVFSCKEFDIDFTVNFIRSFFSIKKDEVNITNRGTEFPRDIRSVREIIRKNRERYE